MEETSMIVSGGWMQCRMIQVNKLQFRQLDQTANQNLASQGWHSRFPISKSDDPGSVRGSPDLLLYSIFLIRLQVFQPASCTPGERKRRSTANLHIDKWIWQQPSPTVAPWWLITSTWSGSPIKNRRTQECSSGPYPSQSTRYWNPCPQRLVKTVTQTA